MALSEEIHDQAIAEIRSALEPIARSEGTITYSDLVDRVEAVPLEPDSKLLAGLLDEISTASDAIGRGMLSAVVVHKGDDYLPGKGFFKLARRLGREVGREPDELVEFHAAELGRVHRAYAR